MVTFLVDVFQVVVELLVQFDGRIRLALVNAVRANRCSRRACRLARNATGRHRHGVQTCRVLFVVVIECEYFKIHISYFSSIRLFY